MRSTEATASKSDLTIRIPFRTGTVGQNGTTSWTAQQACAELPGHTSLRPLRRWSSGMQGTESHYGEAVEAVALYDLGPIGDGEIIAS
jgi:hypothetical protein